MPQLKKILLFPLLWASLIFSLAVRLQFKKLGLTYPALADGSIDPFYFKVLLQLFYAFFFYFGIRSLSWLESILFQLPVKGTAYGKSLSLFSLITAAFFLVRMLIGYTSFVEPSVFVLLLALHIALLQIYRVIHIPSLLSSKTVHEALVVTGLWIAFTFCGLWVAEKFPIEKLINVSLAMDYVHTKQMSDQFLRFDFQKNFFIIGLPIFLAAFNLLSGSQAKTDWSDNLPVIQMNDLLLMVNTLIIYPLSFYILFRIIKSLFQWKDSPLRASLLSLFLMSLYFLYTFQTPPYFSPGGSTLQNEGLMVGWLPGYESLILLYTVCFMYFLLKAKESSAKTVGIVAGLAFLTKETNLLLLAPFFAGWLFLHRDFRKLLTSLLYALPFFALHVAYTIHVYGIGSFRWGGLFPGRIVQWRTFFETHPYMLNLIKQAYGIEMEKAVMMSSQFAKVNLPQMLSFYAIPLIALLVSYFYLIYAYRNRWLLWSYTFGLSIAFFLFHSAYCSIGATYRYFLPTVAMSLFLYISCIAGFIQNQLKKRASSF